MPTPICRESILNFMASVVDTPADKASAVITVASVPFAVWRAELKEASDLAALFVPFLGCTWLLTQIIFKWIEGPRSHDKDDGGGDSSI